MIVKKNSGGSHFVRSMLTLLSVVVVVSIMQIGIVEAKKPGAKHNKSSAKQHPLHIHDYDLYENMILDDESKVVMSIDYGKTREPTPSPTKTKTQIPVKPGTPTPNPTTPSSSPLDNSKPTERPDDLLPIGSQCTANSDCSSNFCYINPMLGPDNEIGSCQCNPKSNEGCEPNQRCNDVSKFISDTPAQCQKSLGHHCNDDIKCDSFYCNPDTSTCECNPDGLWFNTPGCNYFDPIPTRQPTPTASKPTMPITPTESGPSTPSAPTSGGPTTPSSPTKPTSPTNGGLPSNDDKCPEDVDSIDENKLCTFQNTGPCDYPISYCCNDVDKVGSTKSVSCLDDGSIIFGSSIRTCDDGTEPVPSCDDDVTIPTTPTSPTTSNMPVSSPVTEPTAPTTDNANSCPHDFDYIDNNLEDYEPCSFEGPCEYVSLYCCSDENKIGSSVSLFCNPVDGKVSFTSGIRTCDDGSDPVESCDSLVPTGTVPSSMPVLVAPSPPTSGSPVSMPTTPTNDNGGSSGTCPIGVDDTTDLKQFEPCTFRDASPCDYPLTYCCNDVNQIGSGISLQCTDDGTVTAASFLRVCDDGSNPVESCDNNVPVPTTATAPTASPGSLPLNSECRSNEECESNYCIEKMLPQGYCKCNPETNAGCIDGETVCTTFETYLPDQSPECRVPVGGDCSSDLTGSTCDSNYCNPTTKKCDCYPDDSGANINTPGCVYVPTTSPSSGIVICDETFADVETIDYEYSLELENDSIDNIENVIQNIEVLLNDKLQVLLDCYEDIAERVRRGRFLEEKLGIAGINWEPKDVVSPTATCESTSGANITCTVIDGGTYVFYTAGADIDQIRKAVLTMIQEFLNSLDLSSFGVTKTTYLSPEIDDTPDGIVGGGDDGTNEVVNVDNGLPLSAVFVSIGSAIVVVAVVAGLYIRKRRAASNDSDQDSGLGKDMRVIGSGGSSIHGFYTEDTSAIGISISGDSSRLSSSQEGSSPINGNTDSSVDTDKTPTNTAAGKPRSLLCGSMDNIGVIGPNDIETSQSPFSRNMLPSQYHLGEQMSIIVENSEREDSASSTTGSSVANRSDLVSTTDGLLGAEGGVGDTTNTSSSFNNTTECNESDEVSGITEVSLSQMPVLGAKRWKDETLGQIATNNNSNNDVFYDSSSISSADDDDNHFYPPDSILNTGIVGQNEQQRNNTTSSSDSMEWSLPRSPSSTN